MYDIGGNYDIGNEYLVGDDVDLLLSGDDDDDDDIIGATIRRTKKRAAIAKRSVNSNLARAIASRKVMGGAILKDHAFTKARRWPLPFDSVTTVAAGATVNITSNPQMPFKPARLAVGSAIASSFLLNNIIIGQASQFAALNAAGPADAFAPTAFGVDLDCDTAQPNTNIILQVTNASLAALRFTAFMFGASVL